MLTSSRDMAEYYETAVRESSGDPKIIANWIAVERIGYLNRDNKDIGASPVTAKSIAGLVQRIADNTISARFARALLRHREADRRGDAPELPPA